MLQGHQQAGARESAVGSFLLKISVSYVRLSNVGSILECAIQVLEEYSRLPVRKIENVQDSLRSSRFLSFFRRRESERVSGQAKERG